MSKELKIVLPKHLNPDMGYISEEISWGGNWISFGEKSFDSFIKFKMLATHIRVTHPVKFSITVGDINQLPKAFDLFFDLARQYNVLAFKLSNELEYFKKQLKNQDDKDLSEITKHIRIYGPHDSYFSPKKTLETAQEWKDFLSELESLYRKNKIIFPERKNMPMLDTQIGDYCCYRVEYRQMSNGGLHLFLNCEEQDTLHPWHRELNPEINSVNWVGSKKTTHQNHPQIEAEKMQKDNREKVLVLLRKLLLFSENFKNCRIRVNRIAPNPQICSEPFKSYKGQLMIEVFEEIEFFEELPRGTNSLSFFYNYLKKNFKIPKGKIAMGTKPIGKDRIEEYRFFAIEPTEAVIKKLEGFIDRANFSQY